MNCGQEAINYNLITPSVAKRLISESLVLFCQSSTYILTKPTYASNLSIYLIQSDYPSEILHHYHLVYPILLL